MSRLFYCFCVVLSLFVVVSIPTLGSSDLSVGMREIYGSFKKLAPLIYSKKNFRDPDNRRKIKREIRNFSKMAHKVSAGSKGMSKAGDPGFIYTTSRLESEINEARAAFDRGSLEYARHKLRAVAKNCFYCHSQMKEGPDLSGSQFEFDRDDMKPSEVADVYVATRQFKQALAELESVINNDRYAKENPIEYEKVLRKYLALNIRVDQGLN